LCTSCIPAKIIDFCFPFQTRNCGIIYPIIHSMTRYNPMKPYWQPVTLRHVIGNLAVSMVVSIYSALPLEVQAQVAFRGASSAAAPAAGAITYRSRTSGVSGGINYRGSANTGVTSVTPVYRAAASASAANAVLALTINRPAGTILNDAMVASIGVAANTPTITAPSGWTLVRQMNNTVANANSLAVFIKIATAAEPANYTWTFSASGGSAGGIQTFYKVDITNPIDVENGQTTPSSISHTTPSITTTVSNTMLVTAFTYSTSRAWNNPPLVPAVPAVTERIDVRSNINNNVGQSTAAHQGVMAAAGVVPALTASTPNGAGRADTGNTHVLALRPAPLLVPRSALTATGDLMVAAIAVQPSAATVTAPAGWTQVNRIDNLGPPTSNSLIIYRKFAAAGEPASYQWQLSGATSVVGGIQSFVGVDQTTPVDAEGGLATASALAHTAPSVTTTVANTMLVGHYTFASARPWTPPPASGGDALMTESYDVASQAAGAVGQSLEGTRVVHAAIGATALKTATASANADAGATHMMALRPSGTQITLVTPGVVENDVMIAAISLTPITITITPPPGWISIRRTNNAGGAGNALEIFYKVVTNPEPALHTWTFSGNASAVGGIQDFAGVDTSTPVHAEFGQTTPSNVDHTAPSITTTITNTMLVGHYALASSATWAPRNPPGPPVAMTETYDIASLTVPNASGLSLEGTRQLMPTAGATTAFVSRASANADIGNTHMLALLPQFGSNIDLPVPPGTVANDVMIAAIGFQPSTLTITPPAGWALVGRSDNATATTNSLAVYQHVAGAVEPGAYQWTFGGGVLTYASGGIQSFSGVDTATSIDAFNGAATANNLTHATPSINTTVVNTMIVGAHTFASSATWTPAAGMTEAYDRANLVVPNVAGQSIEGSYVAQAAVAATGAKTATASANADTGNTYILALRPSPVIVAPARFNGCESACTPVAAPLTYAALYTKLSGTAFALQGVALKADGTLESGFSGIVAADLVANINTGVALGANNCPGSQDAIITLGNATFASGRATINGINVANAYRDVRLRFTCTPAVCGSAITQCSTDNFAVRPGTLTVTSTTANADSTGTSFVAVPAVKSGATFTLTATALASYNGTPSINTAMLSAHFGAIQNGAIAGSFTAAAPLTGVANGNFTYSEVGYFNLSANGVYDDTYTVVDQPNDCTSDFSNVPSGGRYGCWFGNTSATNYFGRFVPDHFALTTGLLIDRSDINTGVSESVCASSFTYMGEDFKTSFTLAAQNVGNTTTQNYTGSHAKFGLTTWSNYNFTGSSGTLAQGSVVPSGAWGITIGTYGMAVVTATHTVTRPASPVLPYTNFSVSAAPTYTDGAATIALAPSTIVHGGTSEQRYGRLKLFNVYGSELLNLPMPFLAEYWSNGWVYNLTDNCTSDATMGAGITVGITLAPPALTCVQDTISPGLSGAGCLTAAPAPQRFRRGVTPGNFNLNLRAPGAGNTGAVTVTGTVPVWLQFPWTGGLDTNPVARATFGINKGSNVFIYQRENY
jgi:hypothetical protein